MLKRKNKLIITIVVLVCSLFLVGLAIFIVRVMSHSSGGELISYSDEEISPIASIELNSAGCPNLENGFTCTGLCYDTIDNILWVGNYGKSTPDAGEIRPSIIGIDADYGTYSREINLEDIIDSEKSSIQGVAFEEDDNSIWFTDSVSVFHISKDGSLIGKLNLGMYSSYIPNGLAYDQYRDSIWVLFYKNYLIEFDKTGKIIESYNIDFKDQDQLTVVDEQYLLVSVGADYKGQNNYILRIDKNTGVVDRVIRAINSFAIEGLCVIDSRLYVANDGLFHAAYVDSNRILIYEIGD